MMRGRFAKLIFAAALVGMLTLLAAGPAPLGLAIHNVRRRGLMLEVGEPPAEGVLSA